MEKATAAQSMKARLDDARDFMADRQKGKKKREDLRRAVGSWAGLMQEAQTNWPGNAKRQLSYMFGKGDVVAATGTKRTAAEKTVTAMAETIFKAMVDLKDEGMGVRNVSEIGKKHALALIQHWEKGGLTWKTIQTKISFLRRFLDYLNKPRVIPTKGELYKWLDDNGIKVHHSRGSRISEVSQSWTCKGISPEKVIKELAEEEPLVALLLELQLAFGLRKKESYSLEPRSSDEGMRLYIWQGAKGGRPRPIDFDEDQRVAEWQRDLLERAKVFALKHPQRRLCSPDKTGTQMNARINYVLQKYKITRKGLGVTAHGLRHEYAGRRFSAMSGLPPQAEGTAPASAYVEQKEKVKEARIKTSEQLGHWREDITSSYLGSTTRLQKLSKQRMADWLRVFENSPEVMRELQAAELAKCWLVGKAGMGLVMMPDAKLELSIAVKSFDADLMAGAGSSSAWN